MSKNIDWPIPSTKDLEMVHLIVCGGIFHEKIFGFGFWGFDIFSIHNGPR
jgi:hypothetical protein